MQVTCSGCGRTLRLKPGKKLTNKSLCPTCGTPLLAAPGSTESRQRGPEVDVDRYPEPLELSPGTQKFLKRAGGIALVVAAICVRGYLRFENRQRNEENRETAASVEQMQQAASNNMAWAPPDHVMEPQSQPRHDAPAQAPANFPGTAAPHAPRFTPAPEIKRPENHATQWHNEQHEKMLERHREKLEAFRRAARSHSLHRRSDNAATPRQPELAESYKLRPIATEAEFVDGVQLHPHEPFVFTRSHSSQLKTFHLDSNTLLHSCDINDAEAGTSPGNRITTMTITPDGSNLLVGTYRGQVLVYHVEEDGTPTYVHTYRGHQKPLSLIVASPNGQQVLSATASGSVRYWNVATGKNDWELTDIGKEVKAMHFHDDNKVWLCTGRFLGRWNLAKPGAGPEQKFQLDVISSSPAVTFSPTGEELTVSSMGYIKRIALKTGRVISQFHTGSSLYSLKYSHDGERLYAGVPGAVNVYSRDYELTAQVPLMPRHGRPELIEPCRNRQAFLCIQSAHNSQTLFAELQ